MLFGRTHSAGDRVGAGVERCGVGPLVGALSGGQCPALHHRAAKSLPKRFHEKPTRERSAGSAPSVPSSYLFNDLIRYNRYYICMLHQGDPNV